MLLNLVNADGEQVTYSLVEAWLLHNTFEALCNNQFVRSLPPEEYEKFVVLRNSLASFIQMMEAKAVSRHGQSALTRMKEALAHAKIRFKPPRTETDTQVSCQEAATGLRSQAG